MSDQSLTPVQSKMLSRFVVCPLFSGKLQVKFPSTLWILSLQLPDIYLYISSLSAGMQVDIFV